MPVADAPAPRSITLERGRWCDDGTPRVVLSGEIHYFRLPRSGWDDRLRAARDAGLNTVATYIPWIFHELPDATVDLAGRTRPERDLPAFLTACAAHGLDVIARPGPLVMAELKNEGVPYRVARDHPEVRPRGWDGIPTPAHGVDYLAPAFLDAANGWLDAVLPVLAAHDASRGGPVVAVQLDNEVGMLDWIANAPTLSDDAVDDVLAALRAAGDAGALTAADPAAARAAVRAGGAGADEVAVHAAIARSTRGRFARYLSGLEDAARAHGISVPLLINVHGTEGGRGLTYPIGLSQLAPAFRGRKGVAAGTDMYLGDLTVGNAPDLYAGNAFTAAVGDGQVWGSLEFDAGDGDYGSDLSQWTPPEATVLKTMLDVAQGARFINYYLFAGGVNPPLDEPVGDGDERIAFTGQRHGFAAPISPEGVRTPAFASIRAAARLVARHADVWADAQQLYDDIELGFVADHYLTEYAHPAASRWRELRTVTETHRGLGARQALARALVYGSWSFRARDLQADAGDARWAPGREADATPGRQRAALAVATGVMLPRRVQEHLARLVRTGGRLLLTGRLPELDEDGRECTVLADALGVGAGDIVSAFSDASGEYWPSAATADGFTRAPSVRIGEGQLLRWAGGAVQPLLTEEAGGGPLAVRIRAAASDGGSDGTAILVCADYPFVPVVWDALWRELGVARRLELHAGRPGVIAVPVEGAGRRLLTLLNVAPVPISLSPRWEGVAVTPDAVTVGARRVAVLPLP